MSGWQFEIHKTSPRSNTIILLDFKLSPCPEWWMLLFGDSPASEFYMPTFRNTLFHLQRQIGACGMILDAPTCLWRWDSVPKRRNIKFRRREITQKKAYTIILTNVTVLTNDKQPDRDTEPANSVSLRHLYISWTIQTSQVALYSMELLNKQHKRNVRAVLTVGILRRFSERVVTKLIISLCWSVSTSFRSLAHTATAQCSLGSIQYSL